MKKDIQKIIDDHNSKNKIEFNGGKCNVDCNCIEIAEKKNNGEPVKNYPCLEPMDFILSEINKG